MKPKQVMHMLKAPFNLNLNINNERQDCKIGAVGG
jgi:hypothetical protein